MEHYQNLRNIITRNINSSVASSNLSSNYLLTNNLEQDSPEDIEVSELQQLMRSRIRQRLGKI